MGGAVGSRPDAEEWFGKETRVENEEQEEEEQASAEETFPAWLERLAREKDPWNAVEPAEVLRRIIQDVEEIPEFSERDPYEQGTCVKVVGDRVKLRGIPAAHGVVVLKLDSEDCEDPQVALCPRLMGAPWVRSLSLVSAQGAALDLWGLSRLVSLDLTFVALESELDLSPVSSTLLRLVADGIGWSELPASISTCTALEIFSASENDLQSPCYNVLENLKRLREVDLRENPFLEALGQVAVREYRKRLTDALPNLVSLDNQLVKMTGVTTIELAKVDGLREHMNRTDTVADQNEDREGCSCLEGTPCQSEYTCKDWKHRFEIAKYAREH